MLKLFAIARLDFAVWKNQTAVLFPKLNPKPLGTVGLNLLMC